MEWTFSSGDFTLRLSSLNGAITDGTFYGRQLLMESPEAFRLGFRRPDNTVAYISGNEFTSIDFINASLIFKAHPDFPGMQISIRLNSVKKNTIAIYWSGSGFPPGWKLETSDLPVVHVSAEGQLLHPRSEGGIIFHPEKHKYVPPDIQHPEYYIDNYPGRCQMQFMAHWQDDGYGVYFAAHDAGCTPKQISYSGTSNTIVRLGLETFCGGAESSYECPFQYILAGFCGNWIEPCDMYRSWVEQALDLQNCAHFPSWAESSPITLIYPVCGDGTINDTPNQYFPYMNGLTFVEKIADSVQSTIMALLMRWDKNGPWLPPEIWPPKGGERSLLEFMDALHSKGHLLGLYGSGTAYTLKSHTNNYDATEEFIEKGLANSMCTNPDGTLARNEMSGIRTGYYMCTETEYCKSIIREQVLAMAKAGIDFLQYFDQNLGCCNYLCYNREHGHPSVPGQWSTDSMLSLLKELNEAIRSAGHSMLLGTEGAAAECFIGELPFNDLRSSLYFAEIPVPAYSYVFHQYTTNFMGNQVHFTQCIDHDKSPHDMLFRIGWSFIKGDMLSIPMRENGMVDWGNDGDWSIKPPEQKSAMLLYKNLNAIRRRKPEIFLYGRMQRPHLTVKSKKYSIHHKSRCMLFDSILTSGWTTPKGDYAQVLVNYLPWKQQFLLEDKEMEIEPLSAKIISS